MDFAYLLAESADEKKRTGQVRFYENKSAEQNVQG